MLSGPRGARSVHAASHVEEVFNTEAASATIHHQLMVEQIVLDQTASHEAVTLTLVKVSY